MGRLVIRLAHRSVPLALCLGLVAAPPAWAQEGETFTPQPASETVTLVGYTRARTRLPLVSEAEGRVQRVTAEVGEPLPGGGVFACLDRTFVDLELAANSAEQARLRADIAYFRKELARYRNLVARNTAAEVDLDRAQRDLTVSQHRLEGLEVRRQVLTEQRQRRCLSAEPGWLVIERRVEPGQWVNRGQVLAEVGDYDTLLVPFALTAQELAALEEQVSLELSLPELGLSRRARVLRQSPAFDAETRKRRVELSLEAPPGEGRGGLRAELRLRLPDRSGAMLVPTSAVSERYEDHWLSRPDGSRVQVVVLGPGPGDTLRVVSSFVDPDQRFLTAPPP